MTPPSTQPGPAADVTESRRERNKRVTREAILDAASKLFTERGFDDVTTQEIAELADVSNGTFFRYAGTKADLLVEVMTERAIEGRAKGVAHAQAGGSPAESVIKLLEPVNRVGRYHPALVLAYLRELLFAKQDSRADAMNELELMEESIRQILRASRGDGHSEEQIARTARVIYSVTYIDLVRFAAGREPSRGLGRRIVTHINELVDAMLPEDGSPSTAPDA